MDGGGSKLRSFLLGGIVGGVVAIAAERLTARRGRAGRAAPHGLAAFERAPCYRELVEQEQQETERPG
jgi:hypothetical protein